MKKTKRMSGRNESPGAMSAIILAGGNSSRMKKHKALMPVAGTTLIEKVANNISAYFQEIIISAQSEGLYDFLPYRVAMDRTPGQGPLMGILCGLQASSNDINFVIACDIPEVNVSFLSQMIEYTADHEIVVPVTKKNQYEPLFAFYNKSLIPRIETLLEQHRRQIFQLYPMATVKTIPLEENGWYYNLNSEEDYRKYVELVKGESSSE
jgi:molybdopterin-guanine dinucleotide biosynthesis protein A